MMKEIEKRIIALGGICDFKGKSLKDDLLSISFQKSFIFNFSFERIDKYEHLSPLRDNLHKTLAEKGFVPEENFPSIQFTFYISLYEEYEESTYSYFDEEDEGYYITEKGENQKAIMDVKGIEVDASEFMSIGYFEEFFMLMHMEDESPNNPRIYCVDFQTPFAEPFGEGEAFLDFLNSLLTATEYTSALSEYMKKHKIGC